MSYVIAIDGGGSKTDAVAIDTDGTVLGRAQGPGSSPHIIGLPASVRVVGDLIASLTLDERPAHTGIYLSGLDLEQEITEYRAAIAMPDLTIDNDLFALLRAGTSSPDAVAVVCGTGINAIGVRSDGATARFLALGPITGDWGGATGIGEEALWHAARHEDLRGPATTMTAAILDQLGFASIGALSQAIHLRVFDASTLGSLSPLVFEHANRGDEIAISLVERLAEEIVLMAGSCLTRLGLHDVPVVLGGGVIRGRDPRLLAAIEKRLSSIEIVDSAPILGAALLALESVNASPSALERVRTALA